MAKQLIQGLNFMHTCGVIHGDIHPSNVGFLLPRFSNITFKELFEPQIEAIPLTSPHRAAYLASGKSWLDSHPYKLQSREQNTDEQTSGDSQNIAADEENAAKRDNTRDTLQADGRITITGDVVVQILDFDLASSGRTSPLALGKWSTSHKPSSPGNIFLRATTW